MRLMLVAINDEDKRTSLIHFRTPGSKNGFRRFQYKNGSLTPEGYLHYKEMYGWGDRNAARSTSHVVDVKKINNSLNKYGSREDILTKEHTIPKGTIIYRTTAQNEDRVNGMTYVSYIDMDRQHYRAGWIRNQGNTGKAYEHTYTLNEDLRVPSRETAQKVINDVLTKNPELVEDTVNHWIDTAFPKGSWEREELISIKIENMLIDEAKKNGKNYIEWSKNEFEKYREKAVDAIIQDSVKKYGKMTLNEAAFYTMQTLGTNTKVKDLVVRELQRQGYNAMTDEASVGGQNGWGKEGGDPLIIFERSGLLSKISTKEISKRDENKSLKKYNKVLSKANSNRTGAWSAIDQKWEDMLMHAEKNGFDGSKTIQEILDTLDDEQMAAVAYLLYQNKSKNQDDGSEPKQRFSK